MSTVSKWIVTFLCLLTVSLPALACKNTPLKAKHDGIYVANAWIDRVKQSRIVYDSKDIEPMFITVADGKAQLSNAHEVWEVNDGDCLTVEKTGGLKLTPHDGPLGTYKKVKGDAASYFFGLLFGGCYRDQENLEFCMGNNTILDDGKTTPVQLQIDASELDTRGNNLKVEGDKLHWVFVPTAEGWNVYRSDWASAEGYEPFDEAKPWKTLTVH